MVDHMDSINGYHTPKERQLAAVPELKNITDRSKAVLLLWFIFIYEIIFIMFACCMTLWPPVTVMLSALPSALCFVLSKLTV